jgi:hypothetical protein
MSGLGSGGGAGGGGGGFFSGGILLPTLPGASQGSNSTGSSGGGPDEGPTSSPATLPPPGGSLSNPILPDPGSNFIFHYVVDPGGPGTTTPLYFDPPVANGYLFQILSGPNFASVEVPDLPTSTGHNVFTLTFGTMIETLISGTPFLFTSVDPLGVSQFSITGNHGGSGPIVRSLTFDTAITFVGSGPGSFSQTPIYATPEPASLTLWALGAAGLLLSTARLRPALALLRPGLGALFPLVSVDRLVPVRVHPAEHALHPIGKLRLGHFGVAVLVEPIEGRNRVARFRLAGLLRVDFGGRNGAGRRFVGRAHGAFALDRLVGRRRGFRSIPLVCSFCRGQNLLLEKGNFSRKG